MPGTADKTAIPLPAPKTSGGLPVEQALHRRRSAREFANQPLTLTEVGQLLWAAQGITGSGGERTAPSAGALYPLEVYLVAGNVTGLPDGVYRYHPHGHTLTEVIGGDLRPALAAAALDQDWIAGAPAVIVLAAVYVRTTRKYGERGVRYVHMEAGHSAQNVALQATSLHLGTTTVGAFDDAWVRRILGLPADQQPLYLLPVGKPR